MILLSPDCSFDFVAASGALGWDGGGWPWEWPLRWFGLLDPSQFLVVTKTLTLLPRKGNLRWWCPWRCVRKIPGGYVNSVGLTNPGLDAWFKSYYAHVVKAPWKTVLSIAPQGEAEAAAMGWKIKAADSGFNAIQGVEVNLSCPNVINHDADVRHAVSIVRNVAETCGKPVLVKLAWQDDFLAICRALDDGTVAAFDLINTVPWSEAFTGEWKDSPLEKYGLTGGVSGEPIRRHAKEALRFVKLRGIKTPIISGGGVYTLEDVRERFEMGADAVSFGTLFLKSPWKPNQLVRQWRQECTLRSRP